MVYSDLERFVTIAEAIAIAVSTGMARCDEMLQVSYLLLESCEVFWRRDCWLTVGTVVANAANSLT